MANLLFRLSTKRIGDKAEVLLRFYAGAFEQYAHTRIYVPADKWNERDRCLSFSRRVLTPENVELSNQQAKLNTLADHVLEQWITASDPAKGWLQEVVDAYMFPGRGHATDRLLVSEACRKYPEEKLLEPATTKQFHSIANSISRFEQHVHQLIVGSVTPDDLAALFSFMQHEEYTDESGKKCRTERSLNTVITRMRKLRSVLLWCRNTGKAQSCPFEHFVIPSESYGSPYALRKEEREMLYRFQDLPADYIETRDIFIFHCHVGCRISDLLRLTPANVKDGGTFLEYYAKKKKNQNPKLVRVPLSITAQEIINRYKRKRKGSKPKLLPFPDEKIYNERIRFILRLAGITRMVTILDPRTRKEKNVPICDVATTHLARRTFIDLIFKETMSDEMCISMTDHSKNSRAISRYRFADDDMKLRVIGSITGEDLSRESEES